MTSNSRLWKIAVDAPIKQTLTYSSDSLEHPLTAGQWVQVRWAHEKSLEYV